MTKGSDRHSGSESDSEIETLRINRVGKLGAILCPTICALLLVTFFTVSFIATKLVYDQYDKFCTSRRHFDVTKLYVFPNITRKL